MKRKQVKRRPSERTLFERWAVLEGLVSDHATIRAHRSEEGYEARTFDMMWMAWNGRAQQGQPNGDV
jgi:hypothetical protein